MESRSRTLGGRLFLLVWLSGLTAYSADVAEERALGALWAVHEQSLAGTARAAVLTACRQFEAERPASVFLPVSRGLAVWHLLKAGQSNEAVTRLNAMVVTNDAAPIAGAGNTMALRWLTRLDRERVKAALLGYYRVRVQYPEALDGLAAVPGLPPCPLTDRWGKPWSYRLTRFERIRGLTAQRYELESPTLKAASDFAGRLAQPYAGAVALQPTSVTQGGGGRLAVMFRTVATPAQEVLLTEGTDYHGTALVYAGQSLLLLSDGDTWRVQPSPAAAKE